MKALLQGALSLLLTTTSLASYDYQTLQMKNIEQMSEFVRTKIQESEAVANEAIAQGVGAGPGLIILQDTLLIVLSRPNSDNMLEKIITPLVQKLRTYNTHISTFDNIVDISIEGLKNKSKDIKLRATYIFVLENIMSELQPRIQSHDSIKAIYEKIYKKKIKIPRDVRSHLAKNMVVTKSPSKIAHSILKKRFPNLYPPPKPWWKFW